MNPRRIVALGAAAIALAVGAVGCGGSDSGDSGLAGDITIDGSSTVAPLSIGAAEAFNAENSGVNITVGTSGTGGGFEKFCTGVTDISDASRPIKDEEIKACGDAGIEFTELRVASDGITVAVSKGSDLGKTCINFDELKKAWIKGSTINNWSQLGAGWNDVPMKLAGPGDQSGTYDFFNEEVLGEDANGDTLSPRSDYAASEDDNVIVTAIAGTEGNMGYFGFTYFEENADTIDAMEVQNEGDCVAPTVESITSGDYPLARPLFIYVNNTSLEQEHVTAFVRYYLENAVTLAENAAYVPAPQDSLDEALAKVPA